MSDTSTIDAIIADALGSIPESPDKEWFRGRIEKMGRRIATEIATRDRAITQLEGQLESATSGGEEAATLRTQLEEARTELATVKRDAAWKALGVEDDEAGSTRELFDTFYELRGGDKSYEEWLREDAAQHPALSRLLPQQVVAGLTGDQPGEGGEPGEGPETQEAPARTLPRRQPGTDPKKNPPLTSEQKKALVTKHVQKLREEKKFDEAKRVISEAASGALDVSTLAE